MKDKNKPKEFEDRRFFIAGAIIASCLTVLALGDNIPTWWGTMPLFLGFSALLSATYLITTAASLKYSEPNRIYEVIIVNEKVRRKMYDWSIDAFGAYILTTFGSLTIYGISRDFYESMLKDNVWGLFFLILAVGASVSLILVWILNKIPKLIEHYARNETKFPKEKA